MTSDPTCSECEAPFPAARQRAGYNLCLSCGDAAAKAERKSWTVLQPYGKGNYQFITSTAARDVLRQTNQKQIREL